MAALRHLSRMPMGYFEENPSGKLRKIIDENSAQMETYLAHQLPDLVSAQVTTVASLVLMLAMDWRIGLPLIVLMLASFACQMTMMGEKTMNFMNPIKKSMKLISRHLLTVSCKFIYELFHAVKF